MVLPLLPLLFMAGSTLANTIGARKQQDALASTQAAERSRQKKFDNESFAINNTAQDRYTNISGKMDTKSTELADMFGAQSQEAPAAPIITTPESSSGIVTSRENSAMAKAKGETDARAASLGKLRSFGDILGDSSRMQGRDAGQLGLIGSMRRGSQAVLPMELEAAQSKGRGWRLLGDLLSAGGGLLGPGGMMAGGGAGGFNIGRAGSLFGGNSWGA